jgi:dihydroflavonol-4-reductase
MDVLNGVEVERIVGDITELDTVRLAVEGQDVVLHAAANISYWNCDRERQKQVNVAGTRNIARSCRLAGVGRLIHVSSVAAIGIPEDPTKPADESFRFNLHNSGLNYHITKWQAEREVLAETAKGADAVIVNPATIFGRHGQGYRGAGMVEKVRATRIVPYFLGGICAVHVEDVVDGILAAMHRGKRGQRYILGGENISYRTLAERSAKVLGLKCPLVPVPPFVTGMAAAVLTCYGRIRRRRPRITFATHYCASRSHFYNSEKARDALSYSPRGFNCILKECLDWMLSH